MEEEGEEREERNKRELMRKGTRKLRVSSRAWVLHIVVGAAERREERKGRRKTETERGVAPAPRDAAAGKSEVTAVEP